MKVIIEIEEQDDMQKVEAFLKSFEITKVQIGDLQRQQKLQNFFDYLDKTAVSVKKIDIQGREVISKRRPHSDIAGRVKIMGDIINTAPQAEWDLPV